MTAEYWNAEMETRPWADVEAWQGRELGLAVERIATGSEFYRARLRPAHVEAVRRHGLRGLAELPLTGKDELRAAQEVRRPGQPLGSQQAVPLDRLVQIVSSSGTTGTPLYYGLTRGDIETWADACANTFFTAGVRPGDVVGHLVGLPMVAGGLAYADGYRRLGAALAWLGGFSTERILAALPRLQVSALLATTSFGLHLADTLLEAGPDAGRQLGVRKLQLGGEPGLSSAGIRARIKHGWGTDHVREGMGLADVLAAMWSECDLEAGMHFNAQRAVALELVDPATRQPISWADGATGEIIYTTFRREATPVVRYASADRVAVMGVGCACGRTSPRIQVVGRTDDMLIYKGMNVFPAAIRDVILTAFPDAIEPYLRVWKTTATQVQFDRPIAIDIETSRELPQDALTELRQGVERAVREQLQVRVEVRVVPAKTLPRSVHKTPLVAVREPS